MDKKKILILTRRLTNNAGISITLKYLSNGFYNEKYFNSYILDIIVLEEIDLEILNIVNKNKARVIGLNSRNFFSEIIKFSHINSFKNYDIFVCTCLRTYFVLKIFFSSKKIILWIHGAGYFNNSFKNLFFKLTNRYIPIVNSVFTAKISNLKKYILIYNGISKTKKNYSRNELLNKFLIPDGKIIIGNVGHWTLNKNQLTLAKAFNLLLDYYSDIFLIIIGKQTELTEYAIEILNKKRNYIFFDEIKKAPELMSLFDIYVNTAQMEGFGNSIAEAMVNGCPVVTSYSGAVQEIFIDKEDCLFYEPYNDYVSCYNSIKLLLENKQLAKEISQNSKIKINKFYNSNDFAKRFFNNIKNI